MQKPKLIIFDYGNTLVKEPVFNSILGILALEKYFTVNKNHMDIEKIAEFSDVMFQKMMKCVMSNGLEIPNISCMKFVFAYLEIELSISWQEAEQIFWDNAAPGMETEQAGDMLKYLKENGIRSGLISNIAFSGENLKQRINCIFPDNQFEFVLASSDYIFRKPAPFLFQLAMIKSGLSAEEIWFCGDNYMTDILGAKDAGIFPVCFDRDKIWSKQKFDFHHLYINQWMELIRFLQSI